MPTSKPGDIPLVRPLFPQGPQMEDSALDTRTPSPAGTPVTGGGGHPPLRASSHGGIGGARPSFSRPLFRNHSQDVRFRTLQGDGDEEEERLLRLASKPPIPHALGGPSESTPLPLLPLTVLSISMLGEFLSANVSTPFVLFMVQGFSDLGEGADPAYWTGILVSVFFITQFLTSLLWATVADKHGQRTVLFISLLGSALTCTLFGTATSFRQAVVIRLLQGVFAGAIGVARGAIGAITDSSNEGRAYAIMGFCWGLGGVVGAIVGGAFETPTKNWPTSFGKVPLFQEFPYILPCMVASSATLFGAFLSLFLARDGGPRGGSIQLSLDKIEEEDTDALSESDATPTVTTTAAGVSSVVGALHKKLSGYFPREDSIVESPLLLSPPPIPGSAPKPRAFSRSSRAGTAYGFRSRLGSMATGNGVGGVLPPARRESHSSTQFRRRRDTDLSRAPPVDQDNMNFAQRLLLANELNATSLADLWVQAAINAEDEDVFESDTSDDDDDDHYAPDYDAAHQLPASVPRRSSRPRHSLSVPRRLSVGGSHRPSTSLPRRMFSLESGTSGMSSATHLPAIFSHTGVRTPPSLASELPTTVTSPPTGVPTNDLRPIAEDRPISMTEPSIVEEALISEKPPSAFSELPFPIIIQFGLLALHSTTHDQVFYSYLVSKYSIGGLGLNAGHFSQLIAMMCFFQIAYQFYLYPNIGPPRGRFSHLTMFRIGSALYIPSYLTVILYRSFATEGDDGNSVVMAGLAVSTAVRYCATTFAYTAVTILLNYMSPPHVVGLANGLAQSIVSLARFIGPVLGGWLWSISVQDNPNGYPFGFFVVSGVCTFAVLSSWMIR